MTPTCGILLILSGPSGSGKTTLCQRARVELGFHHSVSATTRSPRSGEFDGKDYHFLKTPEFQRRVQSGAFLEHAEVHGNRYGTLVSEVIEHLERDETIVMDIDIQGARQIRASNNPLVRRALVDVFVSPPTRAELRSRLAERGTDSEAVIDRRLENALEEVAAWHEYTYAIPSRSHEEDWQRLQTILAAETLHTTRQSFNLDE